MSQLLLSPVPLVIPAQAGISGRKVTARLAETPAFAGVTICAGMTVFGRGDA